MQSGNCAYDQVPAPPVVMGCGASTIKSNYAKPRYSDYYAAHNYRDALSDGDRKVLTDSLKDDPSVSVHLEVCATVTAVISDS